MYENLTKRIISGILSLVMAFSVFPVTVFAENTDDEQENSAYESIESADAVTEGTLGNYSYEQNILGYEDIVPAEFDFTDIYEFDSTPVIENYEANYEDYIIPMESGVASGTMRYLSDFTESEIKGRVVGWGSYRRDMNIDGGTLSLYVGGKRAYFSKGIGLHAEGYVVFDLGEDNPYDYFSGYLGIDASRGGNGYAAIEVYGGTESPTGPWDTLYDSKALGIYYTGNTNVSLTKLNISNYRYLFFYMRAVNGNGADHTVVCDAKVYSADYKPVSDTTIKTLDEYDEILEGHTAEEILADEELQSALLQRNLVSSIGIDSIGYDMLTKNFLSGSKENEHREMLNWLFGNTAYLREFMAGGTSNGGNYIRVLEILSDLYHEYKDDLDDETSLFEPEAGSTRKRGDLYRVMMFAIALTHDQGNSSWLNNSTYSNPITRYAKFKEVYLHPTYHLRNDVFENLEVEEMRYVMGNRIYDDEIIWTNYYLRTTEPRLGYTGVYSPHRHLSYSKNWHYDQYGFYDKSNYDNIWSPKYHLEEYGVPYSTKPKLWMVLKTSGNSGHICWGISYVGSNFASAFGVPSHYALQPGHAVFYMYNKTSNGRTIWGIDNNISGWTQTLQSETVGNGNNRMLCNWGTYYNGWSSYWSGTYIALASTALDNFAEFEKADMLMGLADLESTVDGKISAYNEVLNVLPYHLDAWYELVKLYTANKTPSDMADLAKRLADEMYYFPLPMYDLMTLLRTAVSNSSAEGASTQLANIVNIEEKALLKGKAANSDPAAKALLAQTGICSTEANYLMGGFSGKLADFSFDGSNAGCIVFGNAYSGVRYRYSLDGGNSWSEMDYTTSSNLRHQLTGDEIASITADNNILIWLEGWVSENGNQPEAAKAFCIDIYNASSISGIEANNNEDRILGDVSNMIYSTDGENWYTLTNDVKFIGNVTVSVKRSATGRTLGSTSATTAKYTFTDNNTAKRSYITIDRESVADFSTQEASKSQEAYRAIDGLLSTYWHSQWSGGDNQRYIVIKLDEPTYFSGLDYTPRADAGNGTVYACQVYVSTDGSNWYLAGSASGWAGNASTKKITFADASYGQYIKFVATSASSGFVSARAIELFEDTTYAGKVMTGVKLINNPDKMIYNQYEKVDISGIRVEVFYTDGSSAIVPLTMLRSSPETMDLIGNHEVEISYLDLPSFTYEVEVRENTYIAEDFTIIANPNKMKYFAGEELDITGLKIKATDSSGKVWYPKNFTVSPSGALTEGETTVTVAYGGIEKTFTVTVDKTPVSIEVTSQPTKTAYDIGESFDTTGLGVKVIFSDETERILNQGEYIVEAEGFSELPGEKTLKVCLSGKKAVFMEIKVTVYSYLLSENFQFDVQEGVYECYLSSYTGTESTVEVPETVTMNGITYKVVGISEGAFSSAGQTLEKLILPGSIRELENGSLSDLTKLTEIYLTSHESFENLTIGESALHEYGAGKIFTATEALAKELSEKYPPNEEGESGLGVLREYEVLPMFEDKAKIISIELIIPEKTVYTLNEALETEGLHIKATMENGTVLTLPENMYSMSTPDMSTFGEKTVTVSVTGTELSAEFTIDIPKEKPVITKNPIDAMYISKDDVAAPIFVTIKPVSGTLIYQWYKSEDEVFSVAEDSLIYDGTAVSYVPSETGYYYVLVWQADSEGTRSEPAYSLAAHIEMEDFPIIVEGRSAGYNTLAQAFTGANNGETLILRYDIELGEQAVLSGKKVVLKALEGKTVIRKSGYVGSFMRLSGNCELTTKNIIFDGGAVWGGEINTKLARGTTNSGLTSNTSMFYLAGGAVLNLSDGTVVQNVASSASGAVVYITGQNSVFFENAKVTNTYCGGYGDVVWNGDYGTVTATGTEFSGGYALYGAAIGTNSYKAQITTIKGCTFKNNLANNDGAAIFIGGSSALKVENSTFEENYAVNGASVYFKQPGMQVSFTGSTFKNNTASESAGAIWDKGNILTITDCDFIGNTAKYAGAINHRNSSGNAMTVSDSEFNGNTTTQGSGGAIINEFSYITFTDCGFEENRAIDGEGGGVIYNEGYGVVFNNCTFTNNYSNKNGGVINNSAPVTFEDCVLTGNGTAQNGGVLYNRGSGEIVFKGSEITSCTATGNGGAVYNNNTAEITLEDTIIDLCSANNGGAFFNSSNANININKKAVSENSVNSKNEKSSQNETKSFGISNCSANNGGGIYNNASGSIDVNTGTHSGNKATNGSGGFIYNRNAGTVNIQGESAVSGCTANTGGAVYNNAAGVINIQGESVVTGCSANIGGAVHNNGNGTLNILGGSHSACKALDGAGGFATVSGGGTINMEGGTIDGCTATKGGGALATTGSGTVSMSGGTIKNCKSDYIGGALYNGSNGKITVTGGTITGNNATFGGGALGTNSGNAKLTEISNAVFSNNSGNYGGAIITGGPSSLAVTSGTFIGNRAGTDGGVICAYNGGTHTISGGTFSNNTATANGGVIAEKKENSTYTPSFIVTGGEFTDNSAVGGGVIYTRRANVNINGDVSMSGNNAQKGKGIYAEDYGVITITDYTSLDEIHLKAGKKLKIGGDLSEKADGSILLRYDDIPAKNTAVVTADTAELINNALHTISLHRGYTSVIASGTNMIVGDSEVVSVDISWGSMNFTYSKGEWNPSTHSYEEGSWEPDSDDADTVTVSLTEQNTAPYVNIGVSVKDADAEDGVGISVTDEEGTSISASKLLPDETYKFRVKLSGIPNNAMENKKLGTVTIAIAKK